MKGGFDCSLCGSTSDRGTSCSYQITALRPAGLFSIPTRVPSKYVNLNITAIGQLYQGPVRLLLLNLGKKLCLPKDDYPSSEFQQDAFSFWELQHCLFKGDSGNLLGSSQAVCPVGSSHLHLQNKAGPHGESRFQQPRYFRHRVLGPYIMSSVLHPIHRS